MQESASRVMDIDIDNILPNRFQPRIQFDEEEILELSDSIREHGVIQPIVVRPLGDKYEIVSGERRYKASVLAGKETIPVIIRNLDDRESAEIALIENVQRKSLTPIEEALSYKKILDMGYITQENLANKIGKSQSSVANKIRLLNLSDEVQDALLENKISERHARSLLKLNTNQQNDMLNRIISERLTVRRTDEEIEKVLNNNVLSSGLENSQKNIEKGENNMNNTMFGIPNVPQQQQSDTGAFDIFANPQSTASGVPSAETPQPENNTMFGMPSQPSISGVPSVETPQPGNNTMFGMPSQPSVPGVPSMEASQPAAPEVPSISSIPTVPEVPNVEIPQSGNNTMFGMPSQPSVPEVPSISSIPTVPEVPSVETPQSGNNTMFEMPSQPVAPEVPITAPIIESSAQVQQQSENLFSFGEAPQTENTTPENIPTQESQQIQESKTPDPIIITDYSKQYDPVMPASETSGAPKVEFKEVISAIRDCATKIEQYGFVLDVEEYDLENLYQVVFKINK